MGCVLCCCALNEVHSHIVLALCLTGIIRDGSSVHSACSGENVEVGLGGVTMEYLAPGNVLCSTKTPVAVAWKVKAQIYTLPAMRMPIVVGQQLTCHIHNLEVPCNITKILRTYDKKGKTKKRRPRYTPHLPLCCHLVAHSVVAVVACRCLLRKQTAAVRIRFVKQVPLDVFADNRRLGRFMLRYSGQTIAAGLVKKVMK